MGEKLKQYAKKPATIKRLERTLRDRLVGREVPFVMEVPDSIIGAVRHSEVEIAKYLEEATHTLAALDDRVGFVLTEPNGQRSFPDILVSYRNGYKQTVEVKSWLTSRNFDVAKLKPLHSSILALDPKYFKTWYAVWSYSKEEAGYRILGLEFKRIWEVCGWTKTLDVTNHNKADVGYTALRPGSVSFDTPLEFLFAVVATTVSDPIEQHKMFSQGVRMLKQEGLYSDVDMLVLQSRVRGTIMHERRHDFVFKRYS